MPRKARLVVPGYPHHITQRGGRGQRTFFDTADYQMYLDILKSRKDELGVEIWAYCLMPNHIHVVAVPSEERSLAALFGVVHRRYAIRINEQNGWSGHLWQERFYSVVMDEPHLLAAVRYVELNPVRAGLCSMPGDWPWSSAAARLAGRTDLLLTHGPMNSRIANWSGYLSREESPCQFDEIRKRTRSGVPAGDERFIEKLEALTGRRLKRKKAGRKRGGGAGVK